MGLRCITTNGGRGPHQHQSDWTGHLLRATSLSLSQSLSVPLALTGRVVLMANPRRCLGPVWGRGKALTSVTVFSTARYKSVTPEKTGT